MQVGDLVRHKDYPQSLAIIVETFGTPTGNWGRVGDYPTIRLEWVVQPLGTDWVNIVGSVWLEVVNADR